MNNLKSHKTVEQIAKKHRMNVSDIQKQLDMGQPIENEHTQNNNLAREIALQHLDEFPDYYTRLKKMEASAKKEHKKFKDIKESMDEKRFCPLCDKKESRSECSYGEKAWDKVSIRDEEYSMARSELENIVKSANRLKNIVGKGEGNLESWVQSKITKAADYIDTAADYLDSGEHKFSESSEIKLVDKIIHEMQEARNETPEERRSRLRASEITPAQRKSQELARKKAADLEHRANLALAGMKSTAKPGAVTTTIKKSNAPEANRTLKTGKKVDTLALKATKVLNKEELNIEEENPCWKGYKQVGTKKKGGKEVPNCVPVKEENVDEAVRLQAQTGNNIFVTLSWRGKYYTMQLFFPQSKIPSRIEVSDEMQKIYPGSKVVTYRVADFKPGEPIVYAYRGGDAGKLGPNKNYVKPMGEEREIEPPRERVGALTNINIPQSEREAARQRTLAKAAANRKKREMKEEVEISEAKKSEMPCNKPKAQAVGDSKTGKSHVVKACEDGKEQILRFGQRGVKGSPKKKGESKEYASRRRRFQSRHSRNIAKGKMSAAYWANKVKW